MSGNGITPPFLESSPHYQGLGFRVWELGFWGLGFGSLGFRILGSELGSLGFRNFGLRVWRFRV